MGLTIHYQLKKPNCRTRDAAFAAVTALREWALGLPFESVGEIVELTGDECNPELHSSSSDLFGHAVRGRAPDAKCDYLHVTACHIIAFLTVPGPGSEAAFFGLARYPRTITTTKGTYQGEIWETSLRGWSWTDFCKTQYALNPECGGLGNFLRCHLTVVQMLDAAKELGVVREVCDESGFWGHRDVDRLIDLMGGWTTSLKEILSLYQAEPRRLYIVRDHGGRLDYVGIKRGSCEGRPLREPVDLTRWEDLPTSLEFLIEEVATGTRTDYGYIEDEIGGGQPMIEPTAGGENRGSQP